MDENNSRLKDLDGAERDENVCIEYRNGEAAPMSLSSPGTSGMWYKLKHDRVFREKFRYSMFIALALMALGVYVGQLGPTFLDLQIITNTDLEEASAFFTSGNTGYMAGSVLVGLIYDKMNKQFLMFTCLLCLGVTNVLVPYCTQYEVMIVVRIIVGIFAGGVDTGANAEHMRIWGTEADNIMHFLHFCFSFGGLMSPLFAEPFLAEKSPLQTNNSSVNTSLPANASLQSPSTDTRVEYVFIITGVVVVISSIPFLIICIGDRGKPQEMAEKRKFSQRNVPFPLLIVMLVGMCVFYFVNCCIEDTFFSFLMAFLVEEYDSVSKSRGAFTTAVAWGSFAGARFLMIFLSKLLTPLKLLILMTISMITSFTCFTIFAHFRIVDALVFLSAFSAMSMSGAFPAGFSWMESKMFIVTGVISSCILVASSLGTVLNPLLVGFLMEEYDTMWYCYVLLGETFVLGTLLVSLVILTQCYVDRKYGSMATSNSNQNAETNEPNAVTDVDGGEGEENSSSKFLPS